MAPGADPAFQQAMDKLMLQVDADNVLAVQRAFQRHADELRDFVATTKRQTNFQKCGEDPVSKATMRDDSFRGKILAMIQVHADHQVEPQSVADRLGDTARSYGFSDAEIQANIQRVAER